MTTCDGGMLITKTKKDYDRLRKVPEIQKMLRRMYEYDRGEWKVTKV